METIKVRPWADDQGAFVVINAADFNPSVHARLDEDSAQAVTQQPAATKTGGGRKLRASAAPQQAQPEADQP